MLNIKKHLISLFAFGLLVGGAASAHNQAPATIRRSMEKAFRSLSVTPPSNVFKGQKTVRVAGATAQVFEAKTADKITGFVVQLEYREQVHVIALDKASGEVKAVVRDGTTLSEDEWKDLSFIPSLRSSLLGSK